MGKWGGVFSRNKWDCEDFAKQSEEFVEIEDSEIEWGFSGQHTTDFKAGITVEYVRWIIQYVGRITDEQLRAGLVASGALPEEVECYTRALRQRIAQLRAVASGEIAEGE